jgi:hypothetical protein
MLFPSQISLGKSTCDELRQRLVKGPFVLDRADADRIESLPAAGARRRSDYRSAIAQQRDRARQGPVIRSRLAESVVPPRLDQRRVFFAQIVNDELFSMAEVAQLKVT